ncbi:hypothetical protein HDU76_000296 [Blyttiomyces sp. JEL0837]|nr:hypothetical protein HDU76_000296 [Blyttiomyces sp. JEL0837]
MCLRLFISYFGTDHESATSLIGIVLFYPVVAHGIRITGTRVGSLIRSKLSADEIPSEVKKAGGIGGGGGGGGGGSNLNIQGTASMHDVSSPTSPGAMSPLTNRAGSVSYIANAIGMNSTSDTASSSVGTGSGIGTSTGTKRSSGHHRKRSIDGFSAVNRSKSSRHTSMRGRGGGNSRISEAPSSNSIAAKSRRDEEEPLNPDSIA